MKCHEALFWREIRTNVIHCFKILYIHIHVGKCSFFFQMVRCFPLERVLEGVLEDQMRTQ